jgi:hypothetical protein
MTGRVLLSAVVLIAVWPASAWAGDYHTGTSLVCSDCHVAHYSQGHALTPGGVFAPLGTTGPYADLLRDDANRVCLACHEGTTFAPDVFGQNGGTAMVRQAGGLNAAAGNPGGLANDPGYDEIDGHTLYSMALPPHGAAATPYVPAPEGLRCIDCHAQHGTTNWRNLLNRGLFAGDTLSYAVGVNDLARDVFELAPADYRAADVFFNEPNARESRYARWCNACHTDFHGRGGDPNMGGAAGGVGAANATPWRRHPTADVNIGESGPGATFISSLAQYSSHPNRVQVMDSQGLWTGTGTDRTLTPSCMSCHKAHGNRNAFGLIFLAGSGGGLTDDGDGGTYVDLCRQCHDEGAAGGGGTASVPWPPPQHH